MAKFSEDELAIIALILDEEEETRRKRKWVHQAWKKRGTEGEFATLYKELVDDGTKFFEYFRMTENSFNLLLNKLEVDIAKQDTRWRKATTPRERLAVCLRYSVTGDAFNTISFSYHIGHSTVQKIGRETCKIIAKNLMTELLPTPTEEMWKKIGTADVLLYSHPKGYLETLGRYGYMSFPIIGATTAFVCTTNAAASIRGKDDLLNWFLGGFAAGAMMGVWRRRVMTGWNMGMLFENFIIHMSTLSTRQHNKHSIVVFGLSNIMSTVTVMLPSQKTEVIKIN
ncbi:unnamed protein product [Acanthoscelides obtectus]|uniref:NADH dehydrogenase [ubiquinone] 1 alpha subcomplex subunit 11 n=1 Tax=Acanthoscelides obtectus TaxID=200917 RepID=A0A9P0JQN1_ACAOB|nr:unnamed protein product [Acanthoscelides obtectus]CAK1640226.1 hypothetical protein AOBTE_LOCUS11608 [Acanthoscelides obtectus]